VCLFASSAYAGPVTTGPWIPTEIPDLELHKSEDECGNGRGKCAAIWLLPEGTETLIGGFGYLEWPGASLHSQQTDYLDAPGLSWNGLSFSYNNGHGFGSSSWGGYHQKLIQKHYPEFIRFWILIEDLPDPIVPDWNDAIYTWDVRKPHTPETPIPEPGSMVLLGTGLLGAAKWIRRRSR
jgi:hypothetical protein